ncbi:hypothetical protein K4K58_002111 [Colletotrichum sp. SAR11_239]|nr:hypothetical protein K4K58_002111 [Colletotrichum sp. SAR11_239]
MTEKSDTTADTKETMTEGERSASSPIGPASHHSDPEPKHDDTGNDPVAEIQKTSPQTATPHDKNAPPPPANMISRGLLQSKLAKWVSDGRPDRPMDDLLPRSDWADDDEQPQLLEDIILSDLAGDKKLKVYDVGLAVLSAKTLVYEKSCKRHFERVDKTFVWYWTLYNVHRRLSGREWMWKSLEPEAEPEHGGEWDEGYDKYLRKLAFKAVSGHAENASTPDPGPAPEPPIAPTAPETSQSAPSSAPERPAINADSIPLGTYGGKKGKGKTVTRKVPPREYVTSRDERLKVWKRCKEFDQRHQPFELSMSTFEKAKRMFLPGKVLAAANEHVRKGLRFSTELRDKIWHLRLEWDWATVDEEKLGTLLRIWKNVMECRRRVETEDHAVSLDRFLQQAQANAKLIAETRRNLKLDAEKALKDALKQAEFNIFSHASTRDERELYPVLEGLYSRNLEGLVTRRDFVEAVRDRWHNARMDNTPAEEKKPGRAERWYKSQLDLVKSEGETARKAAADRVFAARKAAAEKAAAERIAAEKAAAEKAAVEKAAAERIAAEKAAERVAADNAAAKSTGQHTDTRGNNSGKQRQQGNRQSRTTTTNEQMPSGTPSQNEPSPMQGFPPPFYSPMSGDYMYHDYQPGLYGQYPMGYPPEFAPHGYPYYPPPQGATPTSAMSTATGAGQRPSLYDQLKLNMKTTSLFDMVKNVAQMKREMSKITSGMDDLARAQGFDQHNVPTIDSQPDLTGEETAKQHCALVEALRSSSARHRELREAVEKRGDGLATAVRAGSTVTDEYRQVLSEDVFPRLVNIFVQILANKNPTEERPNADVLVRLMSNLHRGLGNEAPSSTDQALGTAHKADLSRIQQLDDQIREEQENSRKANAALKTEQDEAQKLRGELHEARQKWEKQSREQQANVKRLQDSANKLQESLTRAEEDLDGARKQVESWTAQTDVPQDDAEDVVEEDEEEAGDGTLAKRLRNVLKEGVDATRRVQDLERAKRHTDEALSAANRLLASTEQERDTAQRNLERATKERDEERARDAAEIQRLTVDKGNLQGRLTNALRDYHKQEINQLVKETVTAFWETRAKENETKIDLLRQQLDEALKDATTLASDKDSEISRLSKEKADLDETFKNETTRLQDSIDTLRRENNTLSSSKGFVEGRLQTVREKLSRVEAEKKDVDQKLSDANDDARGLNRELDGKTNALEKANDKANTLGEKLSETTSLLEKANEKNAEHERAITDLNKEKEKADDSINSANIDIGKYKDEIKGLSSAIKKYKERIVDKDSAITEYKRRISDYKTEIRGLENDKAAADETNASLRQDNMTANNTLENAKAGVERLREHVKQAQQGKAEAEAQMKALKTEYRISRERLVLFLSLGGRDDDFSNIDLPHVTIALFSTLDEDDWDMGRFSGLLRRLAECLSNADIVSTGVMRLLAEKCYERADKLGSVPRIAVRTQVNAVADVLANRWPSLADLAMEKGIFYRVKQLTAANLDIKWRSCRALPVQRGGETFWIIKSLDWAMGIVWKVSSREMWFVEKTCVKQIGLDIRLNAPTESQSIEFDMTEYDALEFWLHFGWAKIQAQEAQEA